MTEADPATHSFADLIGAAVAAKMTPDFIEKEVNSRVEKLLLESVDRALRSYSDTGKLIEKAVQDALHVDRIDLPSYGSLVSDMLKSQIEARCAELVAGRLAQDMDELLKLAPKEIKLSEIAEGMLARRNIDGDAYGDVITVIVEESRYRSRWLYLDEKKHFAERDKNQCHVRLLLNDDGTISGGFVGGADTARSQWIGRAYGLEQCVRAYIACGTRIILDEDAVVTFAGDD